MNAAAGLVDVVKALRTAVEAARRNKAEAAAAEAAAAKQAAAEAAAAEAAAAEPAAKRARRPPKRYLL